MMCGVELNFKELSYTLNSFLRMSKLSHKLYRHLFFCGIIYAIYWSETMRSNLIGLMDLW